MKKLILILLSVFAAVTSRSQVVTTDSVTVPGITSASQDARGILYIGTGGGDVIRFGEKLKTDLIFSPDRPAKVSLLDASNSLRTFVFYNDLQEFIYLDRFLTESARYSLEGFTTFASLVAPSLDNNIWVFDQQQFSISKINPLTRSAQLTIPLERSLPPGDYNIAGMAEYQNLLFLTDLSKGILIFDNLGNYMDSVDLPDLRHISFNENSIIASTSGGIMIIDIYSGSQREVKLHLSPDMSFQNKNGYRIVSDNIIYSVSEK